MKRRPISIVNRSQIQRAVAVLESVKDCRRVIDLVVAQNLGMRIEQRAELITAGSRGGEDDESALPRRCVSGMGQLRLDDALNHGTERPHDAQVRGIDKVQGTVIRRRDNIVALCTYRADAVGRHRSPCNALGDQVKLDELAPVVTHDDRPAVDEAHRFGRAPTQRDRVLHSAVGQAVDLEREIARDARQVSAAGVYGYIVNDGHVAQVPIVQVAIERPGDEAPSALQLAARGSCG